MVDSNNRNPMDEWTPEQYEDHKKDQYELCWDCRYYEILQEPESGDLLGHKCVIWPDCIYKEKK